MLRNNRKKISGFSKLLRGSSSQTLKKTLKRTILNIVSAYAQQVNNSIKKKNEFWQDLDVLIKSVSKQQRIVLRMDLKGHMRKGNIRDEEIMRRHSAGTRYKEESMIVDFAKKGWIWRLSTLISRKKMNTGWCIIVAEKLPE